MKLFIPEEQAKFARNAPKCLMGDCPTIADTRAIWGEKVSLTWIENQLLDLSEYAGTGRKMDLLQIEDLARIMQQEFYYLKLSEFMLFFAYFKAGRYGTFYGSVDPMIITTALQKFKSDRLQCIARYEQIELEQKRNKQPRNDPDKLTYAEWQELKWLFNMGYERGINTNKVL